MKLLILLSLTIVCLLFAACGKGGGASTSTSDQTNGTAGVGSGGGNNNGSSKSIFSVWTEQGNIYSVDFRSHQFGVASEAVITSGTVGTCQCQVLIQGSENSGTMNFLSCYNGSVGCVELKPSGTYTRTSSTSLRLCSNISCINLH